MVWNATGLHQNEGFTLSFLFRSNSSFSDEGIHIDSFTIFAIERGDEYTFDADCSFPDNFGGTSQYDPESEGGNTILVEAADPEPPRYTAGYSTRVTSTPPSGCSPRFPTAPGCLNSL